MRSEGPRPRPLFLGGEFNGVNQWVTSKIADLTAVSDEEGSEPKRLALEWDDESTLQTLLTTAAGLISRGRHIVRVPTGGPVDAILAGLPVQLAQRLLPLLEARPDGHELEAALRRRFHMRWLGTRRSFAAEWCDRVGAWYSEWNT